MSALQCRFFYPFVACEVELVLVPKPVQCGVLNGVTCNRTHISVTLSGAHFYDVFGTCVL